MSKTKAKFIEWFCNIIGLLSMFFSGYLLDKSPIILSFVLLVIGVMFALVEVKYEEKEREQ